MRVLIGCEFSGTGQSAFEALGHDAWSCDLLPTEGNPKKHLQMDIFRALEYGWDLAILHPDCTYMALCGNGTYAPKGVMSKERINAIVWTVALWEKAKSHCRQVVLENPKSVIFPHLRRLGADVQYVQPYQFGHPETKSTGLALHNIKRLAPTNNVYEEMQELPLKERHKIWYASRSESRSKDRSRSYPGILKAMAAQWGVYTLTKWRNR